jgi:hypothetical protein
MNALRITLYIGALALIKLAVGCVGVRRSIDLVERTSSPPLPTIAPARIDELAHRVAVAGALYPGRAFCLEQSLLLYALLRRARIPARFRLGVRPRPFEAHAWVESNGQPIREDEERLERFLPLPEMGW